MVGWWRALEILPIMPAFNMLKLFNAHYAQNYAGIIGASLAYSYRIYLVETR